MDRERWQRIEEVLDGALELPPAEVAAYLDAACAGDGELRSEVVALLEAESEAGRFLEQPAALEYGASLLRQGDEEGPPPESDPWTGRRLGSYRLGPRLGIGGMGDVYRAEDPRRGRPVAVKILPPELARRGKWLRRFSREARTLAALDHPNIVTLHAIEEEEGTRFLTMELVEGRTLRQAIPEGGLEAGDLLRLATPLAAAVAAAHERGIVHRDLKPSNVMITDDGRVKVLDFGIAKLAADGEIDLTTTCLTHEGELLGTVAYMAPEQLEGHPADARSDVFALGVLLAQMATGEHPFGEGSTMEVIAAILDRPPALSLRRSPSLPASLAAILRRCLEKDPARRYPHAGALHEELANLSQLLETGELPVAGSGWWRRLRQLLP